MVRCAITLVSDNWEGFTDTRGRTNVSSEDAQAIMDFWDMDSHGIRKRITHVIKALAIDQDPLNKQSDICKACCDIFKAGLCEVVSGPFVFPIDTILTFITSKYQQGPVSTYSPLVDLSCCVVTSPLLKNLVVIYRQNMSMFY